MLRDNFTWTSHLWYELMCLPLSLGYYFRFLEIHLPIYIIFEIFHVLVGIVRFVTVRLLLCG